MFEYPVTSCAPYFKEVISKVSSLASKTAKSSSFQNVGLNFTEGLPPVIRLSPSQVIYHYSTKYLTYYVVCELKQLEKDDNIENEAESILSEENAPNISQSGKSALEYDQLDDDSDESEQDEDEDEDESEDLEEEDDEDDDDDEEEKEVSSVDLRKNQFNAYNPIVPLEFLKQLITIMTDYFGYPLVPVKIEANYDTLCLLLSEMIEQSYPFVTDLNQLKDTVQFQGALSRFLSSATSSKPSTNAIRNMGRSGGFSSSSSLTSMQENSIIPWRKANVKYTNNELFVDITEKIYLVMSPARVPGDHINAAPSGTSAFYSTTAAANHRNYSKPVIAKLEGQIDLTSHLSGIPDLQLILNTNGHNMGIPTFHPCIRLDKWQNSPGLMSFIPPDGKCTLANYEIDLDMLPQSNRVLKNIGIIQADFKTDLGILGNEFEITLFISNLKTVKNIEQLRVEINHELHKGRVSAIKVLRLSGGDFQFNSNGKSEWIFDDNLATGVNPVFRGMMVYHEDEDEDLADDRDSDDGNAELSGGGVAAAAANSETAIIFPNHVSLSFSYKGAIPSGIKVGSLKVVSAKGLGENVKPFKGVKYIAKTGQFVLR